MHHSSGDFEWNDEAIQRLNALWDEGHAAAEIGRRMGVSKNAVVGKSHRLNLTARPSPIRKGGSCQARPPRRPRCPSLAELQNRPMNACPTQPATTSPVQGRPAQPAASPSSERQAENIKPARIPALGRQPCCWPQGELGTRSFRFCEAPNEPGKPYCPEHCVAAYQNRKGDEKAT